MSLLACSERFQTKFIPTKSHQLNHVCGTLSHPLHVTCKSSVNQKGFYELYTTFEQKVTQQEICDAQMAFFFPILDIANYFSGITVLLRKL